MRTSSRKAKGRRLQNWVRDSLLSVFTNLDDNDVMCAIMGETGADIKLSNPAKKLIPYSFECKNVEKLNLWKAIEQCEDNAIKIDGTMKGEPVVVFKKNGKMPYVAISLEHFMDLITR